MAWKISFECLLSAKTSSSGDFFLYHTLFIFDHSSVEAKEVLVLYFLCLFHILLSLNFEDLYLSNTSF